MKNTITSPTFLDARDGLLAADSASNAGANQCVIWRAFAGRGMGVSATSSGNQMTVTTATDVPAACQIATTTTVSASANPSVYGQPVTFTATVSPAPNGGPAFTSAGSVTFSVDGNPLGGPVAVNATTGLALSPSTSGLSVGGHTVTAVYTGTTIFKPSTGTLSQSVQRASVNTTLVSSANPSTFGQPVTFTDTVCGRRPARIRPCHRGVRWCSLTVRRCSAA